MQPRKGTASEFVLQTLQAYPDREMRVTDLFELAAGKFTKDNISLSLQAFLKDGQVVRSRDGKEAWWAIALEAPESPGA